MTQNKFLEKFRTKSDTELEHILANKSDYNQLAVAAAIDLLKERQGATAKLQAVESEIRVAQEQEKAAQQQWAAEEKKRSNITEDPDAPELHSKKVVMVFCAIFSTIFGAVLMMFNMKQTNNKAGRIQVLVFGIAYSILTMIAVNQLETRANIALLLNLAGGGILTTYFWNKFIGKDFKHRKRSWVKPAIISVCIAIPLLLAAVYGQ